MDIVNIHKTKLLQLIGCCIFFMLFASQTHAQTRGRVEVIKDPRMDTLIAKRFTGMGKAGTGGGYSSAGYRIQIFSGANRAEAFKAQAKLQEKFPDIPTYISYREPNFKVKVGDFRNRMEATKTMQSLKPWFTLMFIIAEKINPPKLDPENK